MTEQQHLADTIRRACEGDAWHGPALVEVLSGVTSSEALEKASKMHCIWEITLHITAWFDIVRRRLEGEVLGDNELTATDDWPPLPADVSQESWERSVQRVIAAGQALATAVASFPAPDLDKPVPSKDYTYAVMLHGAAQHALYHAGQIALLKKSARN